MADRYSKFLEEVADELRQLARSAPDIAQELHRFSDVSRPDRAPYRVQHLMGAHWLHQDFVPLRSFGRHLD